jgi:hypothetical protein
MNIQETPFFKGEMEFYNNGSLDNNPYNVSNEVNLWSEWMDGFMFAEGFVDYQLRSLSCEPS